MSSIWQIVQVRAGAEMRVMDALSEHKIEVYAPMETRWRRVRGRKRRHSLPYIRGYVFATLSKEIGPLLHNIEGATGLVIVPRLAQPEVQDFIDKLKEAEANGDLDHTGKTLSFEPGAHVRVTKGQFRGAVGAIIRLKGERRAEIMLAYLGSALGEMTSELEKLELIDEEEAKDLGRAA